MAKKKSKPVKNKAAFAGLKNKKPARKNGTKKKT